MNKIEQMHYYSGCFESREIAAIKSAEITSQIAVEFAQWIAEIGAYPCITTPNKGLYVLNALDPKDYTSEELFQEFLKTKQ